MFLRTIFMLLSMILMNLKAFHCTRWDLSDIQTTDVHIIPGLVHLKLQPVSLMLLVRLFRLLIYSDLVFRGVGLEKNLLLW